MHLRAARLAGILAILILLIGCSRPAPATSQPPTPPPVTVPAPASFTLLVNGQAAAPGATLQADFGANVELQLQFPFAPDPATVEPLLRRLPEGSILTWPQPQTARMLVWRPGSFTLDPTGIRDRAGQFVIAEAAPVIVERKPYPRATLYRTADLLSGKSEPAARWTLPFRPTTMILASEATQALLLSGDPMMGGPHPVLLDLKTGAHRSLPVPEGSSWFSAGGWLPDGRLFLLGGGSLLVSADGGQSFRPIATGLFHWVSWLTLQGDRVALWAPPAKVTVVDLRTGARREVPGPFRRGVQDGASNLAWSPDAEWLAGSDFDSDADGRGARIRVVDPSGTRPGRTVEGVSLVGWLADGRLLGWRRGGAHPGPDGGELVLIEADGTQRLLLDRWAITSPDGRFLAYTDWSTTPPAAYLLEVANGKRVPIPTLETGQWTPHGDWLVLEGP